MGHGISSGFVDSRPKTSSGIASKEDKPTWADPYNPTLTAVTNGSPQRRPHSANLLPTNKPGDPPIVAGARAVMRYSRRTARSGEAAMPPSSPTGTPKMIFQNPAKQSSSSAAGQTLRKASADGVSSPSMPWTTNERTSKASSGSGGLSSSRGILKPEGWNPPSSLTPATAPREEDPGSAMGGIGKQFVTKVKAKATNLFTLSR